MRNALIHFLSTVTCEKRRTNKRMNDDDDGIRHWPAYQSHFQKSSVWRKYSSSEQYICKYFKHELDSVDDRDKTETHIFSFLIDFQIKIYRQTYSSVLFFSSRVLIEGLWCAWNPFIVTCRWTNYLDRWEWGREWQSSSRRCMSAGKKTNWEKFCNREERKKVNVCRSIDDPIPCVLQLRRPIWSRHRRRREKLTSLLLILITSSIRNEEILYSNVIRSRREASFSFLLLLFVLLPVQ